MHNYSGGIPFPIAILVYYARDTQLIFIGLIIAVHEALLFAILLYSNVFMHWFPSCKGDGTKPGLWTGLDWTGLDSKIDRV